MSQQNISGTIVDQLGGRRFLTMTGAKSFVWDSANQTLSFRTPSQLSKVCNGYRIKLEANDTYTVTFFKVRGGNVREVAKHEGVHCDQLETIWSDTTKIHTRL